MKCLCCLWLPMWLPMSISSCFKSRAYVPMCFFWVLARGARGHGQIGQIGQIGQNWTHHVSPQPRQVWRRTARSKALSRTKQNGHFRRQIQSSLASERSILEPKGTNRHPTKNSRAFPLVFGVKNRTMRSASSQQKIGERFPPSEGLKWAIPIGKRPEKHQKTKFTSVSPSFKG